MKGKVLISTLIMMTGAMVAAMPARASLFAVQGDIQLVVVSATSGAFGLDTIPVGTTFLARINAVSADGSVFPQDGEARTIVTDFSLQIGDTSWDETMAPPGEAMKFTFLFGNGGVMGLTAQITVTIPAHPDLIFYLPASPGTWEAIDVTQVVDPTTGGEIEVDRGIVSGTYSCDGLQVVPLPASVCLLGSGLLGLVALTRGAKR